MAQQATELNGWNLDAFQATVAAVQENPEAGKLIWRSHATWDAGFGLDVRTDEIEQLGHVLKRTFTLRGDHPPELLGHNTGPTAVETLLAALGSCIVGTYAAQATARGIKIDDLEVEVEAELDLNGFLQLRPVRSGFSGIRVKIRAQSTADDAALEELRRVMTKASPVYDSVCNPVSIESSVERMR